MKDILGDKYDDCEIVASAADPDNEAALDEYLEKLTDREVLLRFVWRFVLFVVGVTGVVMLSAWSFGN